MCLGTLLAACGGDSSGEDDGYVAVGAVGATPDRAPQRGAAPTGDVRMVPLEGEESGEGGGSGPPESGGAAENGGGAGSEASEGASSDGAGEQAPSAEPEPSESGAAGGDGSGGSGGPGGSGDSAGGNSGSGGGSSAEPDAPSGGGEEPSGPAVLKVVGDPVRKALDERWCEKVTVKFRNSGGTPVRSGTVTFGTHVIGALGVDWATIESERKLPAPVDPGETVTESWKLCVDAWRVPLGMHIETQDVSVKWK
ncbi:hypothetical protein [Streptomyces sp. Da 82-17]|uniref:hypothetical protein n=1 Tax=Streptomyces sp. Da 82-17 TaxID=3377116 RepID=UPI0038D4A898